MPRIWKPNEARTRKMRVLSPSVWVSSWKYWPDLGGASEMNKMLMSLGGIVGVLFGGLQSTSVKPWLLQSIQQRMFF